jgi:plastocyanin
MNRIALIGLGILLATSGLVACSSDSNDKSGTGGSGGTGQAGAGGGPGASSFTSVAPCLNESDYTAGTSVAFTAGFAYTPKCLKVTRGASVTFTGSFTTHPLASSMNRGITTDNPIQNTGTGDTATFTFPNPGVYAYFCEFHGSADDGSGMAGAIWVQ